MDISAAQALGRRRIGAKLGLAALMTSLAMVSTGAAIERWDALRALSRVAVDITFSPHHPDLSADELRPRLEEALRRGAAPAIDPTSADRLRLTVAVRSYSGSNLRGFYLPLTQAYGIGPVRLTVERPALILGLPAPMSVQVWQAERQAKGPWRSSAAEIADLTDEVVASFLADYRRALAQ